MASMDSDQPPDKKITTPTGLLPLALLFFIVNFWLLHHSGSGIYELKMLGISGTAIVAGIAALKYMSDKTKTSWLNDATQVTLELLLKRDSIVLAYLLSTVIILTFSSITVMTATTDQYRNIEISRIEDQSTSNKADIKGGSLYRQWVFINPLGSTFNILLEGYRPARITVYPIFGAQIDSNQDLSKSPTLLLRLGNQDTKIIKSCNRENTVCGCLIIREKINNSWTTRKTYSGKTYTSYALGWPAEIADSRIRNWQLELTTLYTTDTADNSATIAGTLLDWQDPHQDSSIHFNAGNTLSIEIYSKIGKQANQRLIVVADKKIADISMVKKPRKRAADNEQPPIYKDCNPCIINSDKQCN